MIQAWIFDLDGTLVQTERLKAQSYAKAVTELCHRKVSEEQVIDAFKQVVGKSRKTARACQSGGAPCWTNTPTQLVLKARKDLVYRAGLVALLPASFENP